NVQRTRKARDGPSRSFAMAESSAATPDATARASLARLIDLAKPEILEQWIELLAQHGRPHQRQAVAERPASLYADFSHVLHVILTWLHAPNAETETRAREEVRSLYRGYGWRWAQRSEAGPSLAVDPPRITQAAWRVLLRHRATDLTPAEVLRCAVTLNVLAMD